MSLPKYHWVKCVAFIRKNETGEVRQYLTELPVPEYDGKPDDHPSIYYWEEGNACCDCNRELFFERVAGNEIETEKCSYGRFSVRLQNPDTLEIYYDEFDKGAPAAKSYTRNKYMKTDLENAINKTREIVSVLVDHEHVIIHMRERPKTFWNTFPPQESTWILRSFCVKASDPTVTFEEC